MKLVRPTNFIFSKNKLYVAYQNLSSFKSTRLLSIEPLGVRKIKPQKVNKQKVKHDKRL